MSTRVSPPQEELLEARPADAPLSEALLRGMDMPGPRYTSYPTADRYVEASGAAEYRQALRQRALMNSAAPLSVYVHIPFCEALCYYCACNKIITKHKSRGGEYLFDLQRELELHVGELGRGQSVSQLHLGGGSPTFLSDEELAELLAMLRAAFRLQPEAELSIEVDPRTASRERLRRLSAMGFNRISFGVQDLDLAVQLAVHRVQPFDGVRELVQSGLVALGRGSRSLSDRAKIEKTRPAAVRLAN